MTIIAAYRRGQKAVIINDFRVSSNETQMDAMMKFKLFDDRFGLFLAGDVDVWQMIIPMIEHVSGNITIDNVVSTQSLINQCIAALTLTPDMMGKSFGAIGFIIDSTTNRNRLFKIEGTTGSPHSLEEISDGACVVIGSGLYIPEIENIMKDNAKKTWNPNDVTYSGDAMVHGLKKVIENCGPSTYEKLGISPVFVVSALDNSNFIMIGSRTEGDHFTTDYSPTGAVPALHFDWSLSKVNGIIYLHDHEKNQNIQVHDIMQYSPTLHAEQIFDPEARMTGFDPSLYPNSNGVVYIIDQWVIDNESVWRIIEKTSVITTKNDQKICEPKCVRIANVTADRVDGVYQRSGKHYLIVPKDLQSEFETGVNAHLFNHTWMRKYVSNYNDLWLSSFFNRIQQGLRIIRGLIKTAMSICRIIEGK